MAVKHIYILGASSMARETFYIYKDLKKESLVRGFIIEGYEQKRDKMLCGKPILDSSELGKIGKNSLLIGAIGSPKRRPWIEKLENGGYRFDTIIHPSVSLWDNVEVGSGCIFSKGVILSCDIKIGKHTIINLNSNINHDCLLGDFVTIGPGSHIGGNVKIGEDSWIGIGTTIIHKINIGKGCFIAAGAVVVKDIPDNTLAMGVPAKLIRKLTAADWDRLI